MRKKAVQAIVVLIFGAACALWVVPLSAVVPNYVLRMAAGFLFYLVLAHCFNLLGGHSGYLNLGQGIFVGVGAYGYALSIQLGAGWHLAICVAVFLGLGLGLVLSLFLFRLVDEAFALVNLALLYTFLLLAHRLREWTGGADGIFLSSATDLSVSIWGMAVLAVCVTAVAVHLPSTRLGYQVRVLGNDVFLAETMGIATRGVMVKLFVPCAVCLSAAGGFFMMGEGYIIPGTVFGLHLSLMPVAMAMVGGMGSAWGPLWGTLAVFGIQELLWIHVGSLEQTLLGVMLIAAGKRKPISRLLRRHISLKRIAQFRWD